MDIGSPFAHRIVNVSYVADEIFIVAAGLSQPEVFARRSALIMYLEVIATAAVLDVLAGEIAAPGTDGAAAIGAGFGTTVVTASGVATEPA